MYGRYVSFLVGSWLGFGIHHEWYFLLFRSSWCMQQQRSFKKLMTKMYLISKFDVITFVIRNIRNERVDKIQKIRKEVAINYK